MPVVPFSSTPQGAPRPKPNDPFILMAAAQMAAEKKNPNGPITEPKS